MPAPELEEIAADALRRAARPGLGPRELAIVAMACASIPGNVEGEAPAPLPPGLPDLAEESEAIEVRQELRRQIGRLEAELASYTRDLSADELPTAPRRAVAHVAGVEELEQTRDTLIAQLSEAQKAAEQRAREEAQSRVRRQRAAEGRESDERPVRRPARQGDELVAGEAVAAEPRPRLRLLRRGGDDDDPHREDAGLRGAPALPLRRGAGRAVPLRAEALLVPAADLDLRPQPRRPRAAGGRGPLQLVRRARPARRLLRPHRDPLDRRRWSPRSSSPASPAPRSPPTSAPARSARSSTPCRCSASTRSRTWSCRASWR